MALIEIDALPMKNGDFPIEIDALPIYSMVDLSMANC